MLLFLACFSKEAVAQEDVLSGTTAASSPSGGGSLEVGGWLRVDGATFDVGERDLMSGIELSQAMLQVRARATEQWSTFVGLELVNRRLNLAYVEYRGLPVGTVRLGQYRAPMGVFAGPLWAPFNQRSMMEQALIPGGALGLSAVGGSGRFSYMLALQGDPINQDSIGNEPVRISGRTVMRLGLNASAPVHIGVGYSRRSTDDTRKLAFSAAHSASLEEAPALTAARIQDAAHYEVLAAEALWMRGSFMAQAEFARANVAAADSSSLEGYSIQAAYFLTGDTRRYLPETATVSRPAPANARYGAWEIGFRFESLDLSEAGGSLARNTALAVNGYFGSPLRLSTAVTRTRIENGLSERMNITSWHLRLQWVF